MVMADWATALPEAPCEGVPQPCQAALPSDASSASSTSPDNNGVKCQEDSGRPLMKLRSRQRVLLDGLKEAPELNGSIGRVWGEGADGRIKVQMLTGPQPDTMWWLRRELLIPVDDVPGAGVAGVSSAGHPADAAPTMPTACGPPCAQPGDFLF